MLYLFFTAPPTTTIYTLSLHDALPISKAQMREMQEQSNRARLEAEARSEIDRKAREQAEARSEEHTSELQSPCNLVCRLLLEKKNIIRKKVIHGFTPANATKTQTHSRR